MEKNQEKIVSIIVPCYNAEKFLPTFFESIDNQIHDHIELICINDGSTDNTDKLIKNYIKNKKESIEVIYIYQNNKGLGGAINTGLKVFSGEYLCWADPDDYLEPESLSKRIEYLDCHPDKGIVTSNAKLVLDNVYGKVIGFIGDNFKEYNHCSDQFTLCIMLKSIMCPGCHMVRKEVFLESNPNREIYESKKGQNWQMLLPIYYKYKRGYLDEPLYRYVIRDDSMDHIDKTIDKKITKLAEHKNIIKETLSRIEMPNNDRKKYYYLFSQIIADRLYFDAITERNLKYSFIFFIKKFYYRNIKKHDIIDLLCLIKVKLK